MDIFNPVFLQIFIDLSLLVAVIVLLWRVNANLKKPLLQSHQDMMKELKAIMAESQASSENFLQALEQSRLALKEVALELELKEQRVKALLTKSNGAENGKAEKHSSGSSYERYQQVVDMIRKGYSEAQTAETVGLAEAEIGLIIDLHRVKNENS